MAQLCGASCGLLLFSAMIVSGLLVGNPIETIATRAIGGLFGGLILGMLVGWIGACIVREDVKPATDDGEAPVAEEISADAAPVAGDVQVVEVAQQPSSNDRSPAPTQEPRK